MKAIETRRMRGQGGFTLIELLVVIAILAVLAGVVVFAVNGINSNSKQTACKTDARTVKTSIQAYYAENTAYPTTLAQLTGDSGFLDSSPLYSEPDFAGQVAAAAAAVPAKTAAEVKPVVVWKDADCGTIGDPA